VIARQLGNIWNMVRQINPDEVHAAVRQPVTLLVLGRADSPAEKLAAILRRSEIAPQDGSASAVQTSRPDARSRDLKAADLIIAVDVKPHTVGATDGRGPVVFVSTRAGQVIVAPEAEHVTLTTIDEESLRTLLAPAIVRQLDEQAIAAVRRLPILRPAYGEWLINETSRGNALYALSTGMAETVPALNIPLNLADMMVLTKNQLVMVYKLAMAAGRPESPRAVIRELLGVIGAGFMWRQVARELVGLIPVIGIIPKIAVAYGGTYAVGQAAQTYLFEGQAPAQDQLQRLYQEAVQRGRSFAESLMARRNHNKHDTEIHPNA
jgi:uncharacterized protein (DUF697 family)